jgi:anaerobic selenocysteine-containing dehydrogenase
LPLALGMIRYWKEHGVLARDFLARHADGLEPLLAAADAWPLDRAAAAARLSADDLRRLAETYADSSPAVLRIGWGLERNRNGAQAMGAILAMPALLGKFGVRGGGYTLSNSGAVRFDVGKVLGPFSWTTREINMTQLGAVLTDALPAGPLRPPIRALYVYNANPAATVPDQQTVLRGLARDDLFTVVHDQVMTDTARLADIVLPATTFLEHWDVRRGYGSYVIGGVRPAVAPQGEARSNEAVFAALGRATGFTDPPFQWDTPALVRKIAEAVRIPGPAVDLATIEAGRAQLFDFPGPQPVQFSTVFPLTPDGKARLTPAVLGSRPYHYEPVASERYPLALISPATSKMVSSTMGEFNYSELRLTMHPRDAAARGIAEGDTVRAFNELGEVMCRVRLSEQVREGVVTLPKGAWLKASLNRRTATALCPATVNEVGGAACFNDARVEVVRA